MTGDAHFAAPRRPAMRIAIILAAALAGCSDAAAPDPYDEAVRQYTYLAGHGGTIDELCAAATKAKDLAIARAADAQGGADADSKELDHLSWSTRVMNHCQLDAR